MLRLVQLLCCSGGALQTCGIKTMYRVARFFFAAIFGFAGFINIIRMIYKNLVLTCKYLRFIAS
jgi:ABC-type transporter lipoprotein component MlaA